MMRRGPKASLERCSMGRALKEPVSCAACDKPKLHSFTAACTCSRLRGGILVCRDCAMGYDFAVTGSSRLADGDWFTYDQWSAMHDRGEKVVNVVRYYASFRDQGVLPFA